MKTIAILSQKGGSGKTTTAIHLAVAAQQAGLQSVVVDLDPQASATMWHESRSDDLPAVISAQAAALPRIMREAERQGADLLFIDTAPHADTPALAAAEVTDFVLVTCRPSVMDLRAIQNTIRICRLAQRKPYVVLTQIDPFGTLAKEAGATLRKLDVEVCPYGLGRRVAYHHGLIDGRTALEYEPNGTAAQEVRALYQHVSHLVGLTSSNHKREQHVDKAISA